MSAYSSQSALSPWRQRLGLTGGMELPLVGFLGAALLVRVLTDDRSPTNSRLSGSLNLSAVIALGLIVVSLGVVLNRRRGILPAALAVLWVGVWTAVAVGTRGASTETLREGVREVSVIALAAIVYNARGAMTTSTSARLVQFLGFAPALLSIYQLASNTGADIAGEHRANGTFAHPNSAAMFFAIAATVSLWQYLDNGRRLPDGILAILYSAAVIATVSIDGLITLVVMLVIFGLLREGSVLDKLGPSLLAGVVLLAFFASPLGAQRIGKESSSSLAAAERGEANSSLDWRLHKWKTLIPEWERSVVVGRGLGTTTTVKRIPNNVYTGEPPHNEFLRYLVETGVLGLVILLAALSVLTHRLLSLRRGSGRDQPGTSNAAALAIVVLIGCLVNSLADNTLLNSPTCYAAALVIAAALNLPGPEMRDTRIRRAI